MSARRYLSRHRVLGFTLLELIVVLVIIGVLAAIAIPSGKRVQNNSHDRAAVTELSSVQRASAALAALDTGRLTKAILEASLADAQAAGADAQAAGAGAQAATQVDTNSFVLLGMNDGAAAGELAGVSSEAHGNVSWVITDDGGGLGLAQRSRSGNCVAVWSGHHDHEQVFAAEPGACVATDEPGDHDGAGDGGDDPLTSEEETVTPIEDRHDEPFWPRPDGDSDGEGSGPPQTVHEPGDLTGPDPETVFTDTDPTALLPFAIASFPSAHSGNHLLYVTLPDEGAIVEVLDATDTNGAHAAKVISTAFNAPSGMTAGPAPSATADGAYRVVYVADRDAGTITAWNLTSGARQQVASGLDTPGHLDGFACYSAAGARQTGNVCLYVTTATGVHQVDVTSGAHTRSLATVANVAGLTPMVTDGTPHLVVSTDGSGELIRVDFDGTTGSWATGFDAPTALHGYQRTSVLTADTGTLSVADATGPTATPAPASIAGVVGAHWHGMPNQTYGSTADGCLIRADGATTTNLWCHPAGGLDDSGQVADHLHAWGINSSGQLGAGGTDGDVSAPQPVTGGSLDGKTVVALDTGLLHTAAVASDGTVHTWGENTWGQLGTGEKSSSGPTPQQVTGGSLTGKSIVSVAAGMAHTVALADDGTMHAWGWNQFGQLGLGTEASEELTPHQMDLGSLTGKSIVSVVASSAYAMAALADDGTLHTWGANGDGMLGLGTRSHRVNAPQQVSGGSLAGKSVAMVDVGQSAMVALATDGTVHAWGRNANNQLGVGSVGADVASPRAVLEYSLAGKTVVAVASGNEHTVAVANDGTIHAWGDNRFGQVPGTATTVTVPHLVTAGSLAGKTVSTLTAGASYTLAIANDGTLHAWGTNGEGLLGTGSSGDSIKAPEPVASGSLAGETVVAVAGGAAHMVAITEPTP